VNGLPAALVSVPDHFADQDKNRRMWHLGGQFADGPLFLFQAPDTSPETTSSPWPNR
jgi:hypothetical protein